MTDPHLDARVKNKLEKQDEIEVSDEEDVTGGQQPHTQPVQQPTKRRQSKKGSPAPSGPPNPRIIAEKLPKQTSAPVGSGRENLLDRSGGTSVEEASERKCSVPVAQVQITESGSHYRPRSELTTPRHWGSTAFSSLSTEESSSICDQDSSLSRQMGFLSLQGSLQDESCGGGIGEETPLTTAEFLIQNWQQQPKDRRFLLEYERVLEDMLKSKDIADQPPYMSNPLNSYYRMLLHRLAEVWGFEHSIVGTVPPSAQMGQPQQPQPRLCLKVLPESKRPAQLFREMTEKVTDEPSRQLMKRPKNHSLPENSLLPTPTRIVSTAMSLEERQANYDRARQRIFNDESEEGGDSIEAIGTRDNAAGINRQDFRRSRSGQSDASSELGYEMDTRSYYQPYGVRPMMMASQMYGAPNMYSNGSLGYGSMESTVGEPQPYGNAYMGQMPYYHGMMPGYASQYIQSQNYAMPYPPGTAMQYTAQPQQPVMYAPQMYSQQVMDPTQQHQQSQYYDPSTGYMYIQQDMSAGYQPAENSYYPYNSQQAQAPQMMQMGNDPRFGPPLIQQNQPGDHQGSQSGEGLIIPLRLPSLPNQQANPLNMYLKIPLNRPPSTGTVSPGYPGDAVQRHSSSSGRSSADVGTMEDPGKAGYVRVSSEEERVEKKSG